MKKYFRYLFAICEKNEKKILFLAGFFAILAAIFETINISALIPLINSIINPSENIFETNKYLFFLDNFFSDNSVINYVIIFLVIFLFKVIYLVVFNWFILSFLKKVERRVTNKLFNLYINQPLKFFFDKKTSEILRNLTNEVAIFRGALQDSIELFVEVILIIFISFLLLALSFKATIVIFILVLFVSFIYINLTKNKINKWAKDRIFYVNNYYQNVIQTFRLITEIKIFNVGNLFVSRNSTNIKNLTNIIHYRSFIKVLPKLVLETVGVIFFVLIILLLIKSGTDLNKILIILGVFLASSIRIISSSNKLLVIYQNIKNSIPSLKILNNELNLNNNNLSIQTHLIQFKQNIHLSKVDFGYEKNKVFNNLDFEIKKNSLIGIFGQSGQGKSTLIRLISSLIKPDKGELFVDNKRLGENDYLNVSIIPQEFNFFEGSIKENITFSIDDDLVDLKRLEEAIKFTRLEHKVFNKSNVNINTKINDELKNLSGGQLQRIALSRAIYKNSDLLILDEATSALDKESEKEIIDLLVSLKKNKTIIIISHNHNNFENCDIVYEIKNKNLIKYDQ
jgi:ATP-binding cassette subfamily C protein